MVVIFRLGELPIRDTAVRNMCSCCDNVCKVLFRLNVGAGANKWKKPTTTVMDPGFPKGKAITPDRKGPTYYLVIYLPKLD